MLYWKKYDNSHKSHWYAVSYFEVRSNEQILERQNKYVLWLLFVYISAHFLKATGSNIVPGTVAAVSCRRISKQERPVKHSEEERLEELFMMVTCLGYNRTAGRDWWETEHSLDGGEDMLSSRQVTERTEWCLLVESSHNIHSNLKET